MVRPQVTIIDLFPRLMREMRIFANKNLLSFAAAVLIFNAVGCDRAKEAISLSPVAIRVGDKEITAKEYRDAFKRLLPGDPAMSREDLASLKRDFVNQLIEEELIVQQAKAIGISVTDEEVQAEMQAITRDYADESFKEAILERYGTIDIWKDEIRKKLIINKTLDAHLSERVKVNEDDAKKYYNEHAKEYDLPEQVRARMIVVNSEDEAREIRKGLTGANFAEVAQARSLSPDARFGGDLGYFAKGEMPKEFEDVVFKLHPGEISPVVKTEYGYHIFLLEDVKKQGKLNYSEVKPKIIQKLSQGKSAELTAKWIEKLKSETKIEVREDLL